MSIDQHLLALAENLLWFSRRQAVDAPILELMKVWELRFQAQGRYFVRNGLPKLDGLFEARKKPAAIEGAVSALDGFTYAAAETVYNATLPKSFSAGAMQTVRDAGGYQTTYTIKSDLVLKYLEDHAAAKLGRDVDATTKDRVRSVLVKGYEEQATRAKITKDIKALFEGFSKRAPQAHIRNRAELIAVNELGTAYSQGALQAGVELEHTSGMVLEKAWALAAGACAICQPNGSQGWIPLDQDFASGHDAPCAHPACRCSLMTRVKGTGS